MGRRKLSLSAFKGFGLIDWFSFAVVIFGVVIGAVVLFSWLNKSNTELVEQAYYTVELPLTTRFARCEENGLAGIVVTASDSETVVTCNSTNSPDLVAKAYSMICTEDVAFVKGLPTDGNIVTVKNVDYVVTSSESADSEDDPVIHTFTHRFDKLGCSFSIVDTQGGSSEVYEAGDNAEFEGILGSVRVL